ncbi:MAG: NADAR family protein [Saprospiraceae bacterium]|nr:NADAR family protein [Saprospiraceae bacterium]
MESRIYNLSESIVFHKTTAPYGGLSNMASGYSLYVNEIIIPTSEHLYQALRYTAFPEIQAEIIAQDNGMKAKMISNKYKKEYSRRDWEQIQIKVMRWVLEIKLAQNKDKFGKLLTSTGQKPIVEYSPKSKLWGAVQSGDQLVGINALGRLLMELRQKYIHQKQDLFCVEPLNIEQFLLYNHPISTICDDFYYEPIGSAYETSDECIG